MVAILENGTDEHSMISVEWGRSHAEEFELEEETTGEEESTQSGELDITAELVLHPFNNAVQALWLCGQLKEELKAEIIYVAGSPEGTIIKVSIRNPISLVNFLNEMTEVARHGSSPRIPLLSTPALRPVLPHWPRTGVTLHRWCVWPLKSPLTSCSSWT